MTRGTQSATAATAPTSVFYCTRMGSLRMLLCVLAGSLCLCGLYSGLDIKYGENGFLCWSAFSLLIALLSRGPIYATATATLLGLGKAAGVEAFTVLMVSAASSRLFFSQVFRCPVDDVQVDRRPYEEEIRELLFHHDPSRLHLVDAELDSYVGREKQLLRKYEAMFAPPLGSSSGVDLPSHDGGLGLRSIFGGGSGKSVVQLAHEEETRRVQATIEASLRRINDRVDRRR